MSRYAITICSLNPEDGGFADGDAVLGYDPGLKTLFLQSGIMNGPEPLVWLGIFPSEFTDPQKLETALWNEGWYFSAQTDDWKTAIASSMKDLCEDMNVALTDYQEAINRVVELIKRKAKKA